MIRLKLGLCQLNIFSNASAIVAPRLSFAGTAKPKLWENANVGEKIAKIIIIASQILHAR